MKGDYVVCIDNGGYLVSLEVRKIYRRLPDDDAGELGMIRVIDNSEEDYLFPTRYFAPIELTEELEQLLAIPAEPVA